MKVRRIKVISDNEAQRGNEEQFGKLRCGSLFSIQLVEDEKRSLETLPERICVAGFRNADVWEVAEFDTFNVLRIVKGQTVLFNRGIKLEDIASINILNQ